MTVVAGLGSVPRLFRRRRAWAEALAAVAAGAAIVLVRLPLQPLLGAASPFLLATPGIIVAALFGGLWPAILTAFLGLWVGERALDLAHAPALGPGGVLIYFAFAAGFVAIVDSRRRLLTRARADAERMADMSQRLAKVARLTAMGEMAGGLAHEINQPLTAISNYAGAAERLARKEPLDGAALADLLANIGRQAMRARDIVARVRGHVGQAAPRLSPQSLEDMIKEAAQIARAGSVSGFRLRCRIEPAADKVLADRIQIEQVLINLIRNAAEAMEGREKREVRAGAKRLGPDLVEVWIADTGPGVAAELAPQLFQPFVSGKSEGLGIGLAVSRNIIEAHGGQIRVETGPEGGAVFCFTVKRAGVTP